MRLALPRRQDNNGPLHKESSPLVAGSNFLLSDIKYKTVNTKIKVNIINFTYVLTYPFGQKFLIVVLRHRISLEVLFKIPTCSTALRFITQIKFMTYYK